MKNADGTTRTYAPVDAGRKLSPRFLSQDERVLIGDRLLARASLRLIAAELGRSPSTISREVRRNRDPATGVYQPFRADVRAAGRRARPKTGKLAANAELRAFVQTQLDRRWSPEQIATMLPVLFPDHPDIRVVHETIYQAFTSTVAASSDAIPLGCCAPAEQDAGGGVELSEQPASPAR